MTVDVVSAADVLRKAQQLVVDRGWDPLSAGSHIGIYDAISLAVWGKVVEDITGEEFTGFSAVCDYFSDAIGGLSEIANWEMAKGRTPSDVYEAFARAINAAVWNETGAPEAA